MYTPSLVAYSIVPVATPQALYYPQLAVTRSNSSTIPENYVNSCNSRENAIVKITAVFTVTRKPCNCVSHPVARDASHLDYHWYSNLQVGWQQFMGKSLMQPTTCRSPTLE